MRAPAPRPESSPAGAGAAAAAAECWCCADAWCVCVCLCLWWWWWWLGARAVQVSAENLTSGGLSTVLGIDLQGCFHMSKAALPHLKRSGMQPGGDAVTHS